MTKSTTAVLIHPDFHLASLNAIKALEASNNLNIELLPITSRNEDSDISSFEKLQNVLIGNEFKIPNVEIFMMEDIPLENPTPRGPEPRNKFGNSYLSSKKSGKAKYKK